MLPPGLRPGRRQRPDLRRQIDFIPTGREHLASARSCKDAKFRRFCRYGRFLSKLGHEAAHLNIGKSCVMAARKLLSLRQQMRKMSAPSRGIFACSKVLSFRGVQNGFDPCTQSLRSFRRGRPYGAQDGQDGFGVDFIHGSRTKLRSSGRQTPTPLLLVFLVAPLARLCLEKVVSDLAKGHLDGNASCLPSNLNRVPPRTQNLPDLISCCSRLGQTYALI